MRRNIFILLFLFCFSMTAQNLEKIETLHKQFDKALKTDFELALLIAESSVKLSEEYGDKSLIIKSYLNLSDIYVHQRNKKKEIENYTNKALELAKEIKDEETITKIYLRLGTIHSTNNSFKKALELYQKAQKRIDSLKHDDLKFLAHIHLSRLYDKTKDSDSSFSEIAKAIQIAIKEKDDEKLGQAYTYLGHLYNPISNDSSKMYLEKAVKSLRNTDHEYLKCSALISLGRSLIFTKEYDQAFKKFEEAETIAKNLKHNYTFFYLKYAKAILYEHLKEYSKAAKKYEEAYFIHGDLSDKFQKKQVYWLLSGVYFHAEDFEKAYDYQEKYIYLNDSLYSIQKRKEFDKIQTEYQVEKKDSQIQLLEKQKEIDAIQKKWLITGILVAVLILTFIFIFFKQRIKTQRIINKQETLLHEEEKKRLKKEQELGEIKALVHGQDKERDRIAKELHDGLGGKLANVNLRLTHINSDLKHNEVTHINDDIKQIFTELRSLSHNLSGNYIKYKDFKTLLLDLKHEFEETHSLQINFNVFPENALRNITQENKHHIYRILQELLINIVKHANAKNVNISFNLHATELILIVEDDGNGFNNVENKKGIGLKNIEERIALLNGELKIDTTPNLGTSIIIAVPFKK